MPKVLVVSDGDEAREASKLPVMYAPPVQARRTIVHRVKKGDTLARIAQRYHVSVRALQRWNRVGKHLRVGQKIVMPRNAT